MVIIQLKLYRNILWHELELKRIKLLQTLHPLGFNDNIYHEGNISRLPDFDVFYFIDIRKRNNRSHGKRKNGNLKRKNKHVLTLSELSIILKHSGQHMALSRLVTLSISSLSNLDIEANKFYDRAHRLYDAAILTRCYTQHALRPYVDSAINHIRHFIKIQFVNKGIEFINLPSIFKDEYFISSIPTYFENKESPIICYKYNKPIRSTVFNYNKLVTELDIENSIPCYQPTGHIVTGDLKIINDSRIRSIICKGPKYRFPVPIDFKSCREEIAGALQEFCNRWCK